MYWKGSILSRLLITDESKLRVTLDDAAILITDLLVEDMDQLVPVIGLALRERIPSLMIIARKLPDSAIGLLLANNKPGEFESVAVKTPGATTTDIAATLEDMAVLTGGRPMVTDAGDQFTGIRLDHLGRARRVWADRHNFGIIGGKGDARLLRKHIADLRASHERAEDSQVRKKLRERIGKLMGGSATLWVGGTSETEIDLRKQLAERTAEALRGAVREGVIPGGGVSLLACRPALREKLDQSRREEERSALRILIKAMEAPIRTIIANAGHDDSEALAEIKLAGPGYGFDVRSERIVDMAQVGIFDAAAVQKAAVRGAVKSAALALTVDVLVHRKKPEESMTP
jgi:chaperonin GroEL